MGFIIMRMCQMYNKANRGNKWYIEASKPMFRVSNHLDLWLDDIIITEDGQRFKWSEKDCCGFDADGFDLLPSEFNNRSVNGKRIVSVLRAGVELLKEVV